MTEAIILVVFFLGIVCLVLLKPTEKVEIVSDTVPREISFRMFDSNDKKPIKFKSDDPHPQRANISNSLHTYPITKDTLVIEYEMLPYTTLLRRIINHSKFHTPLSVNMQSVFVTDVPTDVVFIEYDEQDYLTHIAGYPVTNSVVNHSTFTTNQ